MNALFRITFVALALSMTACQNYRSLHLATVWDYIKENPDSALAVLNEYTVSDFKNRREKAEFALLISIALDKCYVDVASDSLIRIALDYYETRGSVRERMLSWYYYGRVQVNAQDFNKAIVSISRAEEYSESDNDKYQKALISMAKENIYSHTHNYSDALNAAIDGARYFEEAGERHQAIVAERRLAMDYIAMRDFTAADSILIALFNDTRIDSVMAGRCILNYAWSLALQKRYIESLEYYHKGTTFYHVPLSIPQMEQYGVALYQTGRDSEAEALRERLRNIPSARNANLVLSIESLKRAGRYAEALEVQKELVQYEDSVAVQTLEQSLIKTLRDYQQSNSEMFRLKASNRRLAIIGILLISAIAVISLSLLVIQLRRKHRKKEEDWRRMQEEIESLLKVTNERNTLLEDQLTHARRQYISTYKQRFNRIAHLSETYFRSSGSKDGRDVVYREVRELSSFLTTDNRTYKKLEKDVNASLSGAMDWYRREYKDQDEHDYRFVCYLMAGFPASTIGLLTGLSSSNVYVRKNRLMEVIRSSSVDHRDLFLMVLK